MGRQTLRTPLGEIEYGPEDRIALPKGIPGFEDVNYALWVSNPEYEPVKWLILEREEGVALPLLDPFIVVEDYTPEIPDDAVDILEAEVAEDLLVYCVATPRPGQPPTVNLRSPVVINVQNQHAVQVILKNENYPVRYDWRAAAQEKTADSC